MLAYWESCWLASLSASSSFAELLKNSTSSIGPRPMRPCEMPDNPTFSAPERNRKTSDNSVDQIYIKRQDIPQGL